MFKYLFTIGILMMLPISVHAEDKVAEKTSDVCSYIVDYKDAAKADYKPGISITGKPVVEADVDGEGIVLPDNVNFPLTVDLAKQIGMKIPQSIENKAVLGTIVVKENGSVLFNDEPLDGKENEALKSLCEEQKGKK